MKKLNFHPILQINLFAVEHKLICGNYIRFQSRIWCQFYAIPWPRSKLCFIPSSKAAVDTREESIPNENSPFKMTDTFQSVLRSWFPFSFQVVRYHKEDQNFATESLQSYHHFLLLQKNFTTPRAVQLDSAYFLMHLNLMTKQYGFWYWEDENRLSGDILSSQVIRKWFFSVGYT